MHHPEYHSQGLPLTSRHIESKVKLINCRINGTETFWLREASECVLQLRADYLGLAVLIIRPAMFAKSWYSVHVGHTVFRFQVGHSLRPASPNRLRFQFAVNQDKCRSFTGPVSGGTLHL